MVALIRMWQKVWVEWKLGKNERFNQGDAKTDRALIRMWQKSVGLNGNLAKWIGL